MADVDAIVVGSGFGGAVAACRLAQAGASVLVLERGRPWPPGSFPRTPRALRDDGFWEPSNGRHGLFDVRSFPGATALVASGLGGGSLIYANVALRKDPQTFVREDLGDGGHEVWPLTYEDLVPGYEAAEAMQLVQRYPVGVAPYATTPKTRAFAAAAATAGLGGSVEHPPLAVAFAARPGAPPRIHEPIDEPGGPNLHGIRRTTCRLCGECDLGCNDGAKQTLDFTYLSAAQRAGASLRCGCEATAIAPHADGWAVTYRVHPQLRDVVPAALADPDPQRERATVTARVVVLAAGVFGTSELLLRSRPALPRLSARLGERFSANGDLLGFAFGTAAPLDPSRGPVITTSLRLADDESDSGRELLVQEAGSPAFAEWLWQAREAPADLLALRHTVAHRVWQRLTGRRDGHLGDELAEALGSTRASAHMVPLLFMGRDAPGGRLHLAGDELALTWTTQASAAHYAACDAAGRRIAAALGGTFTDGRLGHRLRTMTVHPLGGCAMADGPAHGVVDAHGEVFGHPGLFVADGSVMPGPVGANPSLTIMALAERFAHQMRARL